MDQAAQPLPAHKSGRAARLVGEWKILARLGGPILIAQLAQMANGVVDTVMAGHASAEDLAAVGIGSSLWIPLIFFAVGTLAALQPLIAKHCGANQFERIVPLTWQGLYLAMFFAVIMILMLINVHPILALLQLDTRTAAIAQGYLDAFAWGVPAMLLLIALRGFTDGLGHTRIIMVFSLLGTLINVPLNYILIYGKLGMPAMGGIGCGWATSISHGIVALLLLVYLGRSTIFRSFDLLGGRVGPRGPDMTRLLRLGLPIGFTMLVEVSMFAVVALFLAPLGPAVVAGHQIVLNVVSLLFMVPLSLGMALTLRISFLLGAGQADTARLLARGTLLLALLIALVYAPMLWGAREGIALLYTRDPAVLAVTVHLLVFAALFQAADVIQVTAINALRGYQDTRIPFFIVLFSFWVIALPLGYSLTFSLWLGEPLGAAGFWIALIVGLTLAAILLTCRLLLVRDPCHEHAL